jgi:hypothetical protein
MRVRVIGAHELFGIVTHIDPSLKACTVQLVGFEWWKEGGTPYLAEELEENLPGCTCYVCAPREG